MRKAGTHNFPAIDRVVYGKAASDALKDEAERLDAKRVFLIVSRTLNTKTDEIEKIRRTLGVKHSLPGRPNAAWTERTHGEQHKEARAVSKSSD